MNYLKKKILALKYYWPHLQIKKKLKINYVNNKIDFLIGTHSLQADVKFKNLSFVIIDEQHRFGVSQRLKLEKKEKRLILYF